MDNDGKEPATNAGDIRDVALIPGVKKIPEENGNSHTSILATGNPVDRGAWGLPVGFLNESDTMNNNHYIL